jgi:hypothetical protein
LIARKPKKKATPDFKEIGKKLGVIVDSSRLLIMDDKETLKNILLFHGGENVLFESAERFGDPSELYKELVKQGRFWPMKNMVRLLGRSGHCQDNVLELIGKHPRKYRMVIGFALSSGGTWYYHVWILVKSTGTIGETADRYHAYFGVIVASIAKGPTQGDSPKRTLHITFRN